MNDNTYIKTKLLSIDAWRDDGGWTWNNWFNIEDGIYFQKEVLSSARQLLAYCRKSGWLTEQSKGRCAIEDDGYNVVIIDKNTQEPLIAFCYGEYLDS
jgi:hypothetical protein